MSLVCFVTQVLSTLTARHPYCTHKIPQNSPSTAIVCSTLYCLIPESPSSEKQYLIYSPTGKAFTVQLAADTYSFEWFNPATNAVAQTGTITIPSSGTSTFTPPFTGPDAVLLLLGN